MRPGLSKDERDTWTQAAAEWSQTLLQEGRRPATVDLYVRHVGWLAGDLGEVVRDPWELDAEALEDWLTRQNWAATTRSRVLVSLRSFYTYGVMEGLCARSPLSGVAVVKRRPGPSPQRVPGPWVDPILEYVEWLRAGARAESTIQTRRYDVLPFAQAHGDPWTVTGADLTRWLSRPDWSPSTKRRARAALRSFYSWAHRTGRVEADPSRDLGPVKQRRTLPRPAPDEVVAEALRGADRRVQLALLLGIFAGLRRAEIAGLHASDIGEDAIRVVGKGGHERLVPLHDELRDLLRRELQDRRDGKVQLRAAGLTRAEGAQPTVTVPADGWLFPSAADLERPLTPAWLGKLIARACPPGWTSHSMRHRFATHAYKSKRDLRAVQELLGHSKPETTARYAAVPDGALRDAVAGITLPGPG